jgi:antitoxin component of RelBE/YafQ-DinJ toxin-antitoxin module
MSIQKKDAQLSFRINKELREQYKEYCEDKGFTYSKRIIALMKKDMETNGDIL